MESEPHLEHQQCAGQRIPRHLLARRAVDLPAPTEYGCGDELLQRLGSGFPLYSKHMFHWRSSDSSAINAIAPQPGLGGAGIYTGLPSDHTGLPFVDVSGGFNIGNGWEGELPQVENSFQFSDNLSWVKGNHTMKFGVDARRSRFDQTLYYNVSGNFTFDSSGYLSAVLVLPTTIQGISGGVGGCLFARISTTRGRA